MKSYRKEQNHAYKCKRRRGLSFKDCVKREKPAKETKKEKKRVKNQEGTPLWKSKEGKQGADFIIYC